MQRKIELLAPAGSMANLKAAVCKGADAVYLGMRRFNAREYATNFNEAYLAEAVKICKSNNVKVYLAMNTLVKNSELRRFFDQLSFAYSKGIDAVIIQEVSFIDIIKKRYPHLKIHISTQAGVMNSSHANLLKGADRITLARELAKEEIKSIRARYKGEIEIFCHGALCVSISGQCLFSSLLGSRSGNRGKCAQPCRKKYNGVYAISTKELCLLDEIPSIIQLGVNAVKIEGRMRTPYYAATATEAYRKAIDSYYEGSFQLTDDIKEKLASAFTREFTKGKFLCSDEIFNIKKATGESKNYSKTHYKVNYQNIDINRQVADVSLPKHIKKAQNKTLRLFVRAYSSEDAIQAYKYGADIIYFDLFNEEFANLKNKIKCGLYAVTPRIMTDKDIGVILKRLNQIKPDGILVGNLGMLNLKLRIPIHLDYNLNCFNDIDMGYFDKINAMPIISPELSIRDLKRFQNKDFAVLVHGKIRLMTMMHDFKEQTIVDEKGEKFFLKKIYKGTELLNGKELGLLGKSRLLIKNDISKFFIDTDKNVAEIVSFYKNINNSNDSRLKKNYVLGWSFRRAL